jgi:pullulanase/glycogen debranching enzyme
MTSIMDRRTFLAGTGAVLLAAPLAAEAQQAGKVYRIGAVNPQNPPNPQGQGPFYDRLRELARMFAETIDKILRGAKASETPIRQVTTFRLSINLKTAKALGLTIPPSLLGRADELIQ